MIEGLILNFIMKPTLIKKKKTAVILNIEKYIMETKPVNQIGKGQRTDHCAHPTHGEWERGEGSADGAV